MIKDIHIVGERACLLTLTSRLLYQIGGNIKCLYQIEICEYCKQEIFVKTRSNII